jgi:hypothetical protein
MDVEKLTYVASHRLDYEKERDRCDRLMAEVEAARRKTDELVAQLLAMSQAMADRAQLDCEIAAWRAQPWWRRLVG